MLKVFPEVVETRILGTFTSAGIFCLIFPSLSSFWYAPRSFSPQMLRDTIPGGSRGNKVVERHIPGPATRCGSSWWSLLDQCIPTAEVDAIHNNQISPGTNIVPLSNDVDLADAQNTMARLTGLTLPAPNPEPPLSGTCQWLFSEDHYRDCIESRTAQRLVIYGEAGKPISRKRVLYADRALPVTVNDS